MFDFFFIIFKEEKKAFDRHTAKICQSLERYLNLKSKINDNTLQEVPTHSNHCQEKKKTLQELYHQFCGTCIF